MQLRTVIFFTTVLQSAPSKSPALDTLIQRVISLFPVHNPYKQFIGVSLILAADSN